MPSHPPPQKSWFRRNWLWFVPVVVLVPVIVCCGGITLLLSAIFSTIKSSDVYTEALQRARENPEVVELLGEPIEPGFFVSGNLSFHNSSGSADLSFPISGPNGSAVVNVKATRAGGSWKYSTLEVTAANSDRRIDLLAGEKK